MVMSGPKYGSAVVNKIRSAILFKQLDKELEERKCKKLSESIKLLNTQTEMLYNELDINSYNEFLEKAVEVIPNCEEMISVQKYINQIIIYITNLYHGKGRVLF